MKRALIMAGAALLASCGQSGADLSEQSSYEGVADEAVDEAVNAAMAAAEEGGDERDDSPTFGGYQCTEDCSGHEAGYEWAEEHDIDDPDRCGGNSQSFIEGCQAYAEEQEPSYGSDLDYF